MKRKHGWAWIGVAALAAFAGGCQSVERTISGKPRIERPVEVVYKFENVKRTASLNEWDSIRRVLYLHAKGSVNVTDSNQRRYAQTDLRDYMARFTVPDASHIAKINEEIDELAGKEVAGEKLKFVMTRAEVTFEGANASGSHDAIVRGVTSPGATVHLYGVGSPVDAQADQYGAWAKYVSVGPGQDEVYGYSESITEAGRPPTRKYFKLNVFSMDQLTITEKQFNARPTR
jgi:hypothetical protein